MKDIQKRLQAWPFFLSLVHVVMKLALSSITLSRTLHFFIYLPCFIAMALLLFLISLAFANFKQPRDLILPVLVTLSLIVYLFVRPFEWVWHQAWLDQVLLLVVPQLCLVFNKS